MTQKTKLDSAVVLLDQALAEDDWTKTDRALDNAFYEAAQLERIGSAPALLVSSRDQPTVQKLREQLHKVSDSLFEAHKALVFKDEERLKEMIKQFKDSYEGFRKLGVPKKLPIDYTMLEKRTKAATVAIPKLRLLCHCQ